MINIGHDPIFAAMGIAHPEHAHGYDRVDSIEI
jgi:hypothetical protein